MQILANHTGMAAGLTVATDKDGRDHCVVVAKGTFVSDGSGTLTLADRPVAPMEADEHYGDPASTCVRYECDFAPSKPFTDVLVVGKAVAPSGQRVTELPVRLDVQGRVKDALVVGDRRWVRAAGRLVPTEPPLAFQEMPLTFDLASGGPQEQRNLAGLGQVAIEGTPLPNLERPGMRVRSPDDRVEPIGFGCLSRHWIQRRRYAGTYDRRWFEQVRPFLPHDFDARYFQSAPEDQQFPHFVGGERITCVHMAANPVVHYQMPSMAVPVSFHFGEATSIRQGILDTVVLQPHAAVAMLVWRAVHPLPKKLTTLRGVTVGQAPPQPARRRSGVVGYANGKPRFDGLAAAVRHLRRRRRGAP